MPDARRCSCRMTRPNDRMYLRWMRRLAAPEYKAHQQEVLAPEKEAGRPEVFVSEGETGRPQVLATEDKTSWPKVLTLEEEEAAPNVLVDRSASQKCSHKQHVRGVHGQKRKKERSAY